MAARSYASSKNRRVSLAAESMERLLQINMALLAVLGALMLGMGQQSAALPLLMITAAGLSLWVTDVRGYFHLNRMVANLIALTVAVVVLMTELSRFGSEAQILGVAQLLVYLQIVLLFQRKREREYWQIGMLSLLEVVAAAAFMQGFWFAVALTAYMATGFSALVLICLLRQRMAFEPAESPARPRRARPRTRRHRGHRRWPLAGAEPGFAPVATAPETAGLGRELLARLAGYSVATLLLTALLFVAVPRLGETAWRGAMVRQQSVVGYSPEVTLGELGRVVEDPSEVLRVQFTDYHTNAPARVLGPIYLHGAILTNYHAGRWQSGTVIPSVGFEPLDRYRYTFPPDLVRQRITIEPLRQRELFCVMPFVPLKTDYNISIDYRRKRLLRESHLCGRRFTYQLGTTAIVDGRQRPLTPGEGGVPRDGHLDMPAGDGADSLPRLRELAARWIAESGLPADRVYARARYLESKLARSGLFSYSLQGQNRDSSLDPIDDFLTNNRRGHCEYFATALTLMLRSQGIPARMVLGYKTDEYDRTGGFFQVRQLHAHTWVEAFLEYEQVPPELLHGQSMWGWRNGGWLQLEPTPALRDRMADLDGLHWSPLARAQLWLNTRWSDYVLDMDRSRQQEAIYMPIVRAVQAAWERLTDPAWWRQAMAAWRELAQWPRWQAGLAVSLVLLVLLVIGLLGYRLARWLAPRLAPLVRRRRAGATQSVEFYARLERLLARRGLRRPAGQTPREFAMAAAGQLDRDLAEAPERVVAAFYQVRFGRRPLDKHQAEAVEQALGRIDTAE